MLLFCGASISQLAGQEDREQRMEAFKIGFITEKLELSTEEAQRFWPVYNEFQAKLKDLKRSGEEMANMDLETLTEEDAEKKLTKYLELEDQRHELQKEYMNKLSTVITKKKQVKLIMIEKKYRKELVSKLRKRMEKRRNKRKY